MELNFLVFINFKIYLILGTLLTAALLMRAIDRKSNHSTTLKYLSLLIKADPIRTGYYIDLMNKWNIEEALENWINANAFSDSIDLSELKLVTIFYEQYLCVANTINLKGCPLRKQNADKLNAFIKCKVQIIE